VLNIKIFTELTNLSNPFEKLKYNTENKNKLKNSGCPISYNLYYVK